MEICGFCEHNKLWKAWVAKEKQRYQCPKCKRTMSGVDCREKYIRSRKGKWRLAAIQDIEKRRRFKYTAILWTIEYERLYQGESIKDSDGYKTVTELLDGLIAPIS